MSIRCLPLKQLSTLLLLLLAAVPMWAAGPATVAGMQCQTISVPDITYLKVGGVEVKLDVYAPAVQLGEEPWVRFSETRRPTLLYIHGGGWVANSRGMRHLNLLPFIQRGWCVVNIDYRLLGQAPMPACIADCRQALNWIYDNADKYRFDTSRIVVSGESAGGHLALMTGLMTGDDAIRVEGHPISRPLRVAAIINWYGVADLERMVQGWNSEDFVKSMFGDAADRSSLFKLCSPLSYVTEKVPPVMTIHGEKDPVVPMEQATRLHEALQKAKARHRLYVVKGRKHGDFTQGEMESIYGEVWAFLKKAGI